MTDGLQGPRSTVLDYAAMAPAKPDLRPLLLEYLGMVGVLAALVAGFSLLTRHFWSAATLTTIANQVPDTVVAAVGMTFVLLIAGIDLSVGSVLALSGAVMGWCMIQWGWPLELAIPAAMLVGLICGLVNGLVTVRWNLPSFIVTLGMLEMARGAAYLVTGSRTQYLGSKVEAIDGTRLLGVSLPFLLALAVVAAGQVALLRTVFGRHVLAVGGNEEAARFSGIDPKRVKVTVFALSGLMAGLASVIQVSRLSSADPNMGSGLELSVIASVVIGGTSLMGGRGSVVRSFLGVLIIAVLGAGLAQVGAQEPSKRLITGAVIVAAVVLDYYRSRLGRRGGVQ